MSGEHAGLVLAALLVLASGAGAQSGTGDIQGVVTDESGAPLASATVTVVNTFTGAERVVTTDRAGRFAAPVLPGGPYEVTAAHDGLAPRRQEMLRLHVGETISLRLELRAAPDRATITVVGTPPTVERARTHSGSRVSTESLEYLPLSGRNALELTLVVPGVLRDPAGGLSIAGQPPSQNRVLVDGGDIGSGARAEGVTGAPYPFALGSIDEFQVATTAYPAEYGRATGGILDVVTRSGGNRFTGSAFEFFGDDALNANTRINEVRGVPKPSYESHQFGGGIGGPLVEDRHFFFAAYDALRRSADQDILFARSDHHLAADHRLWLRYNRQAYSAFEDAPQSVAAGLGAVLGGGLVNDARVHVTRANAAAGRDRLQFTDTVVGVAGAHLVKAGVDLLTEDALLDNTGHAVFVQDEIRTSDALMLHAGVRYAGALAPRFGLAWAPTAERRVIVRGGYGRFYGGAPALAGSDSTPRTDHASAGIEWEWMPSTTVGTTYLFARNAADGTSYNAATVELHRRFYQGAEYRAAYTLGDDPHARHRFVGSMVYGTSLFADRVGGWMEPLLTDWTLGAIYAVQSTPRDALTPGAAYVSLDTRVTRHIGLGGSRDLQVIWEAFNLRNRANYALLGGRELVPLPPRMMQLGIRLLF